MGRKNASSRGQAEAEGTNDSGSFPFFCRVTGGESSSSNEWNIIDEGRCREDER